MGSENVCCYIKNMLRLWVLRAWSGQCCFVYKSKKCPRAKCVKNRERWTVSTNIVYGLTREHCNHTCEISNPVRWPCHVIFITTTSLLFPWSNSVFPQVLWHSTTHLPQYPSRHLHLTRHSFFLNLEQKAMKEENKKVEVNYKVTDHSCHAAW